MLGFCSELPILLTCVLACLPTPLWPIRFAHCHACAATFLGKYLKDRGRTQHFAPYLSSASHSMQCASRTQHVICAIVAAPTLCCGSAMNIIAVAYEKHAGRGVDYTSLQTVTDLAGVLCLFRKKHVWKFHVDKNARSTFANGSCGGCCYESRCYELHASCEGIEESLIILPMTA